MFTVLRQNWLESERGWGIRPDGYSIHLTQEDCTKFIKDYWERMPDQVPDEYSRPDGEPSLTQVDASTYEAVKASPHGIRRYH